MRSQFDVTLFATSVVDSVPMSVWYGSQKISDFVRTANAWLPFQGTLWERVTS